MDKMYTILYKLLTAFNLICIKYKYYMKPWNVALVDAFRLSTKMTKNKNKLS